MSDVLQIPLVGLDVRHQDWLALRGRGADNAFAQRDGKIAHHFFAVADGVANAQIFALLVEEQNREQIVGDDAAHDAGDAGEQFIEIESLGGDGRNFQQEIEQIAALAELDGRFSCGGRPWAHGAAVASMIFTLGAGANARGARRHHGLQIFQRADAAGRFHAHRRAQPCAASARYLATVAPAC